VVQPSFPFRSPFRGQSALFSDMASFGHAPSRNLATRAPFYGRAAAPAYRHPVTC